MSWAGYRTLGTQVNKIGKTSAFIRASDRETAVSKYQCCEEDAGVEKGVHLGFSPIRSRVRLPSVHLLSVTFGNPVTRWLEKVSCGHHLVYPILVSRILVSCCAQRSGKVSFFLEKRVLQPATCPVTAELFDL